MPFDPKIIAAEDPPRTADGDIDLPADFAALGDQLRDDAVHLARCYPAASSPPRLKAAANRRYRRTIAALCGSVVAASMLAFGVFHFAQRPALHNVSVDSRNSTAQSSFVSSLAPSETISLSELSQPELEAVLDLMEREPNTPVSVSF